MPTPRTARWQTAYCPNTASIFRSSSIQWPAENEWLLLPELAEVMYPNFIAGVHNYHTGVWTFEDFLKSSIAGSFRNNPTLAALSATSLYAIAEMIVTKVLYFIELNPSIPLTHEIFHNLALEARPFKSPPRGKLPRGSNFFPQ